MIIKMVKWHLQEKLKVKAALINIFLLTVDQMTAYNIKDVA